MLGLATLPPTALSQGNVDVAMALMPIQGADRRAYSPMSHSLKGARAPLYKCISLCPTHAKGSSPKLNPFSPSSPRSIFSTLAFKNQTELVIHKSVVP